MVLTPEIVDAVGPDVPVLGAGGIGIGSPGRGLARARRAGRVDRVGLADHRGVPEPQHQHGHDRRRSSGPRSADTVRARVYTGKPARLLKTKWTEAWAEEEAPEPLPMPLQNLLVVRRAQPDERARRPRRRSPCRWGRSSADERGAPGRRRDGRPGGGVRGRRRRGSRRSAPERAATLTRRRRPDRLALALLTHAPVRAQGLHQEQAPPAGGVVVELGHRGIRGLPVVHLDAQCPLLGGQGDPDRSRPLAYGVGDQLGEHEQRGLPRFLVVAAVRQPGVRPGRVRAARTWVVAAAPARSRCACMASVLGSRAASTATSSPRRPAGSRSSAASSISAGLVRRGSASSSSSSRWMPSSMSQVRVSTRPSV